MEEHIKEKDRISKKGIKNLIFWSTLTSSILISRAESFIVTSSIIQQKTKIEKENTLEKEGKTLYKKYKEENKDIVDSIYHFYKKPGTIIYEEKLAVITPNQNSFLTINEEGIFKWVSLDGNIYNNPNELFEKSVLKEVSEEQKPKAIASIMGIEKQTSFSFGNLTLLSEVKDENLYQTIYQNSKDNLNDIKVVAKGTLYQTPYGYQSIYTSTDGIIKADNLASFAILYENKELYMSQQTKYWIEKGKAY